MFLTGFPHKRSPSDQEVKIMKRSQLLTLLFAALLMALSAGMAFAADKPQAKTGDDAAQIAKMSGKDLYKTRCKVCHLPDSDAGEYTPMSLIMEQWEDFFDGEFVKTHKNIACTMGKAADKASCKWEKMTGEDSCCPKDAKMVPDMFNKDMLKKIKKFCVDHAADSEQPMTCG